MGKLGSVLEPLWVSRIRLRAGDEVKTHVHKHIYHLIYIIAGEFQFNFNGEHKIIGEQMLVIARPGDKQGWRNIGNCTGNTYEIKFTVFDEELRHDISKLPDAVPADDFARLSLEKIFQEADSQRDGYQNFISLYLSTMLHDLTREKAVAEIKESAKRQTPTQMAVQYIKDHYSEALSLESVSAAINFDKTYLSATFKRTTGDTVNNFIGKIRVYTACELIAYSDLSLAEVSAAVGFKSEQHFNRLFQKHIGIPPGEYRSATPKEMICIGKEYINQFDSEVMPVRSGRTYEVDSKTGTYLLKEGP